MKKILIVHASAGEGHRKAAESIYKAFESLFPADYSVELINILDLTNPFFKWIYEQSYLWMITKAIWLWGLGYYWFDAKWMQWPIRISRRILNGLHTGPFCRTLQQTRYDVIVSTHFLATEVVSDLKHRKKVQAQLVTVVTDLGGHAFWTLPPSDRYVVGVETTARDLEERGVERDRIDVLGIPIRESFAQSKDAVLLKKRIGLKDGVFTVLIIGGGSGVGPILQMVDQLASLFIQLLIVCGKNEVLYQNLLQKSIKVSALLKPLGYVDNIDELMAVSHCIITKSGGLTVCEALASHLPLIIIDPIPGQERKNCEVIVRAGAGIEAKNPTRVREIVQDLIQNPAQLHRMKQKTIELAHPHAARDIAELAIRLVGK